MTTAPLHDDALRALHARGRAAWPAVELDAATFARFAAPRLEEGALEDIRADDLYLAIACAVGNDRAIAALDQHFLAGIGGALARRGVDAEEAAEVVQQLRVRFLVGDSERAPRIAEYDGRGALATWLRVAAVRLSISAHRKQHRETAADEIDLVAAAPSPELDLLRHRFGAEFKAAFRAAFEALAPRERNLLRYQVIDRFGIDRVAALHGVHRATAARWLVHAREALLEGVRGALQHRLGVGTEELESMFRMLHSELEITMRMFLTPEPPPAP